MILQRDDNGSSSVPTAAASSPSIPEAGAIDQNAIARFEAGAQPGIVQITNEQQTPQAGSGALVPASVGTGFVIDGQGHILTNDHVIAQAQQLQVQTTDGRTLPTTFLGRDSLPDLAVLPVNG